MKLDNRKILAAISVVAAPLSNPFRGNPTVVLATIVSYITVQNIGIILSYLLMHQTLISLLKTCIKRWKSFTDFVLAEASHCWFGTFITVTVFKTLCFTLLRLVKICALNPQLYREIQAYDYTDPNSKTRSPSCQEGKINGYTCRPLTTLPTWEP